MIFAGRNRRGLKAWAGCVRATDNRSAEACESRHQLCKTIGMNAPGKDTHLPGMPQITSPRWTNPHLPHMYCCCRSSVWPTIWNIPRTADHPPGSNVTVYYDPANPQHGVLDPHVPAGMWFATPLVALFAMIWAGLGIGAWKRLRSHSDPVKPRPLVRHRRHASRQQK